MEKETNNSEQRFLIKLELGVGRIVYKSKEDIVESDEINIYKIVEKLIEDDRFLSSHECCFCFESDSEVNIFINCYDSHFFYKVEEEGFSNSVRLSVRELFWDTDFNWYIRRRYGSQWRRAQELRVDFKLKEYGRAKIDWVKPQVH